MGRSKLFVLSITALLVAACSFTRKSVDDCKTNADCRTTFGVGSVCGGDGLCAQSPPNARCSKTFPADLLTRPQNYPNVIMIGSIMDRSSGTQVAREQAIQLATQQVNDAKGLDGHTYGVILCDEAVNSSYDSLARTDAAVADAKYLAEVVGVPAIVGPSASGDVLAVFAAIKNDGVLVMSPAATSPDLTTADLTTTPSDAQPGLLWRTAVPDTVQGQAIAIELQKKVSPEPTKVVVIDEQGAYGTALAKVFTDAFQDSSHSATTIEFTTAAERDAAIVTAVNPTPPPYVLFFSSQATDAQAFLNAAGSGTLATQYANTKLFLTDSAANSDLIQNTPTSAKVYPNVIGSRPATPTGTTYELFDASYNAAFHTDPGATGYAPQSYDATWLVFYGTAFALRQEKKISGIGIARGLRKISATGPIVPVTPANWVAISNAIGAGTPINLEGASGTLDYSPTTEETTSPIDIWHIDSTTNPASIVSIGQIDPATGQ